MFYTLHQPIHKISVIEQIKFSTMFIGQPVHYAIILTVAAHAANNKCNLICKSAMFDLHLTFAQISLKMLN